MLSNSAHKALLLKREALFDVEREALFEVEREALFEALSKWTQTCVKEAFCTRALIR